jgi:peptide/nickel transport system substrate-binding protein
MIGRSRRILVLGAMVALLGGTLPSMGAAQDAGPTGELRVALSAESESMDPYLVYQAAGISIMNALFDTLVSIDRSGAIGTGGLASSWEVISDNQLRFTLRDGITFHDGAPLTAEDVKFSLDRVRSETLGSGYAGGFAAVASVDVVDPSTVDIMLTQPDAGLLAQLGQLQIVSKAYHDKVGDAGFATNPVGTGPFTFVEWVKDDHATLAANPGYWDGSWKGGPEVATVVFRPIPDAGTRIAELTTGGIDLLQDLPSDKAASLDGSGASPVYMDDGHHFEMWTNTGGTGEGAIGEVAKSPTPEQAVALEALAKPEVRTALNMAVDRALIIETLLEGYGTPMTNVFVPGDLGYDPSIPEYAYDPEAARAMLAEAGYPDGFSVDLDYCTCDRLDPVEAVVAQLGEIGVTVTIKPFEVSQFNDDWIAGRSNPLRASRLGFVTNPGMYLDFWIRTGGLVSLYSNPAIDALIADQAVTMDPAARAEILKQIGALSHEDPPAIFLWSSGYLNGARDGVSWQPHVLGYLPVFGTSLGA